MFSFPADVPSGLQTAPQVTAIAGSTAQLTCRASRYIYSNLAWSYPSLGAAHGSSLTRSADAYSISLTLIIANVTEEHSGLYKCRAQHQHNGSDTLEQHTRLLIRGGWYCPAAGEAETLGSLRCPSKHKVGSIS